MSTQVAQQVSIDSVKAYWDTRPCNIRHSRKPVGSKEYFDEVETRKYYVEPHIPGFAQFARWRGAWGGTSWWWRGRRLKEQSHGP